MTTEQPYFVVKVTRCGECPNLHRTTSGTPHCWIVASSRVRDSRSAVEVAMQNADGITPTCPMWPQRVEEKKDV